jgi:Suppressor of fused protein (SUFU)
VAWGTNSRWGSGALSGLGGHLAAIELASRRNGLFVSCSVLVTPHSMAPDSDRVRRSTPGGAITGDASNELVAVGFVDDPSLPPLDTPNGTVAFVQVFGMTAEQLGLVLRGESELGSFAGSDGLFVTDPHTRR